MFLQNLQAKVGAGLGGGSEAGFTLIELLVVMLILGTLAAIVLPAFFNRKASLFKKHSPQSFGRRRSQ